MRRPLTVRAASGVWTHDNFRILWLLPGKDFRQPRASKAQGCRGLASCGTQMVCVGLSTTALKSAGLRVYSPKCPQVAASDREQQMKQDCLPQGHPQGRSWLPSQTSRPLEAGREVELATGELLEVCVRGAPHPTLPPSPGTQAVSLPSARRMETTAENTIDDSNHSSPWLAIASPPPPFVL